MRRISSLIVFLFVLNFLPFSLLSLRATDPPPHCQVPCGIYGDSIRIELIYEHIETIDKSMRMIDEISNQEKPDYNQLVRWVVNKEEHAEKIQEIVSQYFLNQRIKIKKKTDSKESYSEYLTKLELLHHISVYAMKAKQSTNRELIEILKMKVHEFEHAYFGDHHH